MRRLPSDSYYHHPPKPRGFHAYCNPTGTQQCQQCSISNCLLFLPFVLLSSFDLSGLVLRPSMALIRYQINGNCAGAVLPHPAALRFNNKHSNPCNQKAHQGPWEQSCCFWKLLRSASSHLCVKKRPYGDLRSTQQRPES